MNDNTNKISKYYPFHEFEEEILQSWQDNTHDLDKIPYCIIMPPPNVTGSLHLGHALSSTLQDVLIRFHRMQGDDVLWLPGTDHAGIATQMMVEKSLTHTTRETLGREAFLEHMWRWKDTYGNIIVDQMKRLGFSADWSQLCFTLDPHIHHAVNTAFVRLFEKGLIYRAERLVNWDSQLKTALSDLEVKNIQEEGKIWTIRYCVDGPLSASMPLYVDVATTRPETIFGDMAVAVHPEDARYKMLIGQHVRVPLTDRIVPVIADDKVDREKGTGAVKITPAHDFLDFDIANRSALPKNFISIFDETGQLNAHAPSAFQGMSRSQAREAVLKALEKTLIAEEKIVHSMPYSERSGVVIEPRLTTQWFVDTKNMAQKVITAIEEGKTTFVPNDWKNHYLRWLQEIQPWCISRQLWWGHRMPVWYGPKESIFVAVDQETAYAQARGRFGDHVVLRQEEDVLDTWFSSGLWPFATLGWPHTTPNLARYYPTGVLITGFDILFFWVARMMMLGLEMTGKVPFHNVFIHPLIQDEDGQKMSKTKQNVINPLDVIHDYGADALRFSLITVSANKQYARFGLKQVESARNFMTKIWNAARFLNAHNVFQDSVIKDGMTADWMSHFEEMLRKTSLHPIEDWWLGQLSDLIQKVTKDLNQYAFQEAALALHHAFWHVFCDWYLEFAKTTLQENNRLEIHRILAWSVCIFLKMLHPFVPFITEKLWFELTEKKGLYQTAWPKWTHVTSEQGQQVPWMMEMITCVRRLRAEFSLPRTITLTVFLYDLSQTQMDLIHQYHELLCRWLSLDLLQGSSEKAPAQPAVFYAPLGNTMIGIPLPEDLDSQAEEKRLKKLMERVQKELCEIKSRLAHHDCQRTPQDVVKDWQKRQEEKEKLLAYYAQVLAAVNLDQGP